MGEVKVNSSTAVDDLEPWYVIAYSGDKLVDSSNNIEIPVSQDGYKYNGIYSSVTFCLCTPRWFSACYESYER